MKRYRFTQEQISHAIKQADSGEAVTEICRQMGVSRQAFYQWRSKYAGMGMMERRLRWLEEENHKLKRLVADLSLQKHALQKGPSNGNSAMHIIGPTKIETYNRVKDDSAVLSQSHSIL